MKITLTNRVHSTKASVIIPGFGPDGIYTLSTVRSRAAWEKLCAVPGCDCTNWVGAEGDQREAHYTRGSNGRLRLARVRGILGMSWASRETDEGEWVMAIHNGSGMREGGPMTVKVKARNLRLVDDPLEHAAVQFEMDPEERARLIHETTIGPLERNGYRDVPLLWPATFRRPYDLPLAYLMVLDQDPLTLALATYVDADSLDMARGAA